MPNALSLDSPEAPQPVPQQAAQQRGAPQQQAAPAPAPYVPPPAPNHAQTVAALRHFSAIEAEMSTLLKNPDCGKSNIRGAAIDGATKLVARGILTPSTAVSQLADMPEKPFDQRKWIETHLKQAVLGATKILDDHRNAFAGMSPPPPEPIDPSHHHDHMAALMKQYQGGSNA